MSTICKLHRMETGVDLTSHAEVVAGQGIAQDLFSFFFFFYVGHNCDGWSCREQKENEKWGYFPPMQTNHVERCYSLQSSCFPIKLSSTSVFCLIHFLVTCWGPILGPGWTWTKLIPLCRHWKIFHLVPRCLFKQNWRGWVKDMPGQNCWL